MITYSTQFNHQLFKLSTLFKINYIHLFIIYNNLSINLLSHSFIHSFILFVFQSYQLCIYSLYRMQKIVFLLLMVLIIKTKDPQLSEHILPIYGNSSLGYYYVKLYIGTPPQEQSVILDTGSGQLALPCNRCMNCNPHHLDRPFDMRKSQTAKYVTCQSTDPQCKRCLSSNPTQQCRFMISYAQGSSLQGVIIQDNIKFQSFSQGEQITATFGCTIRQTNLFLRQQVNGIFGLSPQRTSPILQDLYRKHHPYSGEELVFSLCMARNGGQMVIGRRKDNLHRTNQSVKTGYVTGQRNVYAMRNVGEIRIGDYVIHNRKDKFGIYGIFMDSGSTLTYFPRQNYLSFKTTLLHHCSLNSQLCQLASGQSMPCFHLRGSKQINQLTDQIFPPLTFEINEKIVQWKATGYFMLRDVGNREICLGVDALDRYLLGANWMVERDVVFDIKEKTVEIFSNVNCLNNEGEARRMSQFSEDVKGHKPLNYESGFGGIVETVKNNSVFFLIIGVVLIIAGVLGVFVLIIRHGHRQVSASHNPVKPPSSTTQTEDHIQLAMNSSSGNNNGSLQ